MEAEDQNQNQPNKRHIKGKEKEQAMRLICKRVFQEVPLIIRNLALSFFIWRRKK
jgi:hypothetical protein